MYVRTGFTPLSQIRVLNSFLWSNWSAPISIPANNSVTEDCILQPSVTKVNNTQLYAISLGTFGAVILIAMVVVAGLVCLCCMSHKRKRHIKKQLNVSDI